MAATPKRITVTPESKVTEVLADADAAPVLLEKDGAQYRVSRDDSPDDIWAGYEPDAGAVNRMLDEVAGRWSDLDLDRMIAELYEARERGSRPVDRPLRPSCLMRIG